MRDALRTAVRTELPLDLLPPSPPPGASGLWYDWYPRLCRPNDTSAQPRGNAACDQRDNQWSARTHAGVEACGDALRHAVVGGLVDPFIPYNYAVL